MLVDPNVIEFPAESGEICDRNFETRICVASAGFSRALAACLIFISLFFVLTRLMPNRDRVDVLVRNLIVGRWCPRFERFLISSANPDVLIMSSSTGFVPSELCDIKNNAISLPVNFIALQKLSERYEQPAFFLMSLVGNGVNDMAVVHCGIPTANVSDNLLMLKKAFAYGKHPKVVIFAMNFRELAFMPCPEVLSKGGPIEQEFSGITAPPSFLREFRLFRFLFIAARPKVLERVWDCERFYFAYEIRRLVRRIDWLKTIVSNSDAIAKATASPDKELTNYFDAKLIGGPVNIVFNPEPNNSLLRDCNGVFVDRQFKALEASAKFLHDKGSKLLICEVPLYPGTVVPEHLQRRYQSALTYLKTRYGVLDYAPADEGNFESGHFEDLLHMDALGGECYFWRMANFLAQHREELSVGR